MKLNFKIDPPFLAATAIFDKHADLPNWEDLKNRLWDKYRAGYIILMGKQDSYEQIFVSDYKKYIRKAATEVEPLINEVLASKEYAKLLKQTEEYKTWLENEWKEKGELVIQELTNIIKTDLPKDEFEILLVPPTIRSGTYMGNNTIIWGHNEDWNNYSLVYLSHEVLHKYLGRSQIEHAIIELATDNELRRRLNGEGDYFTEEDQLVGHRYLKEIKIKLLPEWEQFLAQDEEDIFEFAKRMLEKKI